MITNTDRIKNILEHNARSARQWAAVSTILVTLMFWPARWAMAQITTGSVTGTVTDNTGAVIPGASLTLTNQSTGTSSMTTSGASGTYAFMAVKPGPYTLHVSKTGFSTQISQGIQVNIQQTVSINIKLLPGTITQTVKVMAGGMPLLQSQDASVGQTIDEHYVNNLPLNGRNWVSLGQLAAGTTTTGGGAPGQPQFSANGVNFQQNDYRLNGIDDNLEVYGLGGSITIQSEASVVPIPDAIHQFKLQSGNYSAEFGHSTGAVINAVVKSGTRQYAGNLFEYFRNTALDANSYFSNQAGLPRTAYHQNQFGGTFGGPVPFPGYKHAAHPTFFFFDYQYTGTTEPNESTTTVPTDSMIDSGYTNLQDLITDNSGTRTDALGRVFPVGTVFDPATTRMVPAGGVDPVSGLSNPTNQEIAVRDPFFTGGSVAGITNFTGYAPELNTLPAGRLDPNAVKLLGVYPHPTAGGFASNFFYSPTTDLNIHQYDIRIDHNLSNKDLLWGVFDWYHINQNLPGSLPGVAQGGGYGVGESDSPHYAVAVSYTHIFSPTLLNEFHIGLDKDTDNIFPLNGTDLTIPQQFGIQGVPQFPQNGGLPNITISGLNTLGVSGYQPVLRAIHSIETADTVTKTWNKHTFIMGYQLFSLQSNIFQPPAGKGDFSFTGQYSDIPNNNSGFVGIADLLLAPQASTVPGGISNLGGLSSFTASTANYVNIHRWYMGAFFQDNYKIMPNLTLNLGLRWDHNTPNYEIHNRSANMVANGGNGPGGIYYMPKATCSQAPPAFVSLLAKDGISLQCISNANEQNFQSLNFAPRLGFAYSVTPHLVVRGGYGISYGALDNIGAGSQNAYNFPFEYTLAFTSANSQTPLTIAPGGPTPTLENALTQVNLTDPQTANPEGLHLASNQFHYQTPYIQTYNLAVQQQLGNADSIQFAYVGDNGRHLDNLGVYNTPSQILPPGANLFDFVPFPDFSLSSSYVSTNAISSYNSLQVTYNHATSHGLSLLANYTYSKCMTNLAANRDGISQRAQWLPGFGIGADYQLCPNDATNVVHLSGFYQLPFGRSQLLLPKANAGLNALVGGWSLNYIFTYQSGQPFSISCPVPTTASFGCNANIIPGANPYAGKHNQQQWVNPDAFANPPVATAVGENNLAVLGSPGNQVRGPGFTNLDASIFKDFHVNEKIFFQFRAEAFNVTNTAQFANPGSSGSDVVPGNGTNTNALDFENKEEFGRITALVNNNRIMQLALKLYF